MAPIPVGSPAPPVPGAPAGPHAVAFYKVTCPVCQMAAPKIEELAGTAPVVAVGQDPEGELTRFAVRYGMSAVPTTSEAPPYPLSDTYGVRVVPTLFLVDGTGTIADVVESWDREGFNRLSRALADATGAGTAVASIEGDGLPAFRPG